MHATTALLPLLALATTILAAPTSLRPVVRAVPDLNMVIRNPEPIDHRAVVTALLEGNIPEALNKIVTRAPPALDKTLADPVDVVGRAVPAVEHNIKDPVDVVG